MAVTFVLKNGDKPRNISFQLPDAVGLLDLSYVQLRTQVEELLTAIIQ